MKSKKTLIIAEAGVNHNGNLNLAKKLIVASAKSGADYVKFQTFDADSMIRKTTKLAKYQKINLKKKINQYELLKKYQLKKSYYKYLLDFSKKNKIGFISSPFDIESVKFLKKFNLDYLKIPSGEIDNLPYLIEIAKLNKNIILSTGMSTLKEVSEAIKILTKYGTKRGKIALLHCHTEYPSLPENLNLKSIITLKNKFKLKVGYSDHSSGKVAPIVAVGIGCEIIEKHITLNKKMSGPDHKASMEPNEFKDMVNSIRISERMLGDGKKVPTKIELRNKSLVRKSLIAKTEIKKGEKFTKYNLTTKRPALGLSPLSYKKFLGIKSKKNYKADDYIEN